MLTDAQWAMLEPLIEACRPPAKVPPRHLRRTVGAILWRHDNGAKWRAVPEEHGPWWMAAQTFIRWSRLGVWERLPLCCTGRGSGRTGPYPVRDQATRTDSGRPNSSMRLRAWTPTFTSVARRPSVRERNPSPITRLNRPTAASARARAL